MSEDQQNIIGKEIHGYKVIKPLGQGKFSIVYKAHRVSDDLLVALKMIKIFDMMDPKQREKCLKEVKLLQSLNHPNIVQYLDSFIADNDLLIAIEWAEKGDLKRVIKRAQAEDIPLDETKVWEYTSQIAKAIKHMQDKRIMHRDLKPANIFIASDGSLKLGDLGLGRYFSSQTMEAYSRVGTPLYMSPEVLQGSGYDWKSDVWSLGCVAYELCCLKSPFKREDQKMNLYDLFNSINKGEYPPIRDRYSQELRDLINGMIIVEPQNRLDIETVVRICDAHQSSGSKRPKIDPFLIMDDIHEKLRLLDYELYFCREFKKPPLTRIYFAHDVGRPLEQLHYFYDLAYWLMNLSKIGKGSPAKPTLEFSYQEDPTRIANQLLADIKKCGIRIPEQLTNAQIKEGHGEGVCYIINDLLNRELIRQDFKFGLPSLYGSENGAEDELIEDEAFGSDGFDDSPNLIQNMYKAKTRRFGDEDGTDQDGNNENDEEGLFTASLRDLGPSGEAGIGHVQQVVRGEDLQLLENYIDPEAWMTEVARVKEKLKYVVNSANELEEWRYRRERVLQSASEIRGYVEDGHTNKQSNFTGDLNDQLERIRFGEKRINSLSSDLVSNLDSILQVKKQHYEKLEVLREQVARKIEEFDNMTEAYEQITNEIEDKSTKLSDNSELENIRTVLRNLKTEIRDMNRHIVILKNMLLRHAAHEKQMADSGKHIILAKKKKKKKGKGKSKIRANGTRPDSDTNGVTSQKSNYGKENGPKVSANGLVFVDSDDSDDEE